jgi:protease I
MAKIAMILAQEGFRDEEYAVPKRLLGEAGHEVVTSAREKGEALGKLGMRTQAECALAELRAADYDAIVCVGGPGSLQYWDDAQVHALLREAQSRGAIVAGICSAAVTLARSGVLAGRRATVFPGDAEELKPHVGQYTAAVCEQDGKCVTANGPAAAEAFGKALCGLL